MSNSKQDCDAYYKKIETFVNDITKPSVISFRETEISDNLTIEEVRDLFFYT